MILFAFDCLIAVALITVGVIYFCRRYGCGKCRHAEAYWVKAGAMTQTPKAHHEQNKIYLTTKDSRWCPACEIWLDLTEEA